MGASYQIRDQSRPYFFTFQVVGWADVFSRKIYRDMILESFDYCRKAKGMNLFSYVIMTNHIHAIMQSKNNDLSGLVRDLKKFTSKSILNKIYWRPTNSPLEKPACPVGRGVRRIEPENEYVTTKNTC